jgi:hypothetical protein
LLLWKSYDFQPELNLLWAPRSFIFIAQPLQFLFEIEKLANLIIARCLGIGSLVVLRGNYLCCCMLLECLANIWVSLCIVKRC